MKLNHLNLLVEDVSKAIMLFEDYFDFTIQKMSGENMFAVLHGQDGFVLVIMSEAMSKTEEVAYPAAFHIGFLVETRAEVTATWQKLRDGGIQVGREPGKIRDTFGFYFTFQKILIEVSAN